MVRLLRVMGVILMVAGVGSGASYFYVQMRFYAVMPHEPDPTSGRIYPFTANRFRVYVTREERDRGRWAGILFPFGIIGGLVGIQLLHRASDRRR